ncbi:glycoside hydrolase family 32 protein [Spirosoma luteum]|uniref:glycoside hydrolase family 32 protein n=1 Tax=Spirosoma luteum TaxID=431553 RepID=UPI0003AA3002|nr:glycoside hydrolase family 32 protein [Spirosoma luteum]
MQRKNLVIALLAFISISQTACNQSAKTESSAQTSLSGDSIDYRPQYHFSAPKGWINDPNGLIYANGQYHLFYQHNPFGNVWGHMSWGHAVSADLLHWEDLPVAIPEFTNADSVSKTGIFSGSTVVDKGNKSGLCPDGTGDCMVSIYTGNVTKSDVQTNQYQNLAYSTDKGRTWTQYAKNPVLDLQTKEFRDPNVFWYEPQQKWLMAVIKPTDHQVAFYDSKNLKDWKLLSLFGPQGDTTRVWECPSIVQVPIENEPGKSKWVVFVSAGHPQKNYLGMQYFVGNFDGKTFTLDNENPKPIAPAVSNPVDWGKDYYAAIPFNDLPGTQKNPVMIGWLNDWEYANKIPTATFRGAMSLPRQIALRRTPDGLVLVQTPIAGVASLRGTKKEQQNLTLTSQSQTLEKSLDNVYELEVEISPGTAKTVGIRLAKNGSDGPGDEETIIRYVNGKLELDRRKSGNVAFSDRFPSVETAPLKPQNNLVKLRIFVDRSVVTVFANDGERVITDYIFPTKATGAIDLFAEGGTAEFKKITIWPMKSTRP